MKTIFDWWQERKFEQYAKRLKSPQVDKVGYTLHELGRVKDRRALPLILPMLRHSQPSIRWSAVVALLERRETSIGESLLSAYSAETDPFVRMWMAVGLAHFGRTEGMETIFDDIALLDAEGIEDWDSAPSIVEYIAYDLGEKALPYLSKGLIHPNSAVRWVAVMTLGELDSLLAQELLLTARNDLDTHTREEVKHYLKERAG